MKMPRFKAGHFNNPNGLITAFVIESALVVKNIREEYKDNENNDNDPFPAAESEYTIITITHSKSPHIGLTAIFYAWKSYLVTVIPQICSYNSLYSAAECAQLKSCCMHCFMTDCHLSF